MKVKHAIIGMVILIIAGLLVFWGCEGLNTGASGESSGAMEEPAAPGRAPTCNPPLPICNPASPIQIPFSWTGTGEYCWKTTTLCYYINSWCLEELYVNGCDYTNQFVLGSAIPKVNGKYTITYKSTLPWGHFEIAGALITGRVVEMDGNTVVPIAGAVVSGGGYSTTSNAQGYFTLMNSSCNTDVLLTITKSGYFTNYRKVKKSTSFPIDTGMIVLLDVQEYEIDSEDPDPIDVGGKYELTFPPDAFADADGDPYNGPVVIRTNGNLRTAPNFTFSFPGDIMAIDFYGFPGCLISYVFIYVYAVSDTGAPLQLRANTSYTLEADVPDGDGDATAWLYDPFEGDTGSWVGLDPVNTVIYDDGNGNYTAQIYVLGPNGLLYNIDVKIVCPTTPPPTTPPPTPTNTGRTTTMTQTP